MFNSRNAINTYVAIDNNQQGASFEKRWFESVLMVINRVMNNEFNAVETHKKLLEVCEGLQWVQENLNEKLNSQHRNLAACGRKPPGQARAPSTSPRFLAI